MRSSETSVHIRSTRQHLNSNLVDLHLQMAYNMESYVVCHCFVKCISNRNVFEMLICSCLYIYICTSSFYQELVFKVEVEVTLRLTASQSVWLGAEPTLGLVTRYYFLSESCGLVSMGRPLSREDGSAVCSAITQWSESRRTRNHT
jgi:hypothetical protein